MRRTAVRTSASNSASLTGCSISMGIPMFATNRRIESRSAIIASSVVGRSVGCVYDGNMVASSLADTDVMASIAEPREGQGLAGLQRLADRVGVGQENTDLRLTGQRLQRLVSRAGQRQARAAERRGQVARIRHDFDGRLAAVLRDGRAVEVARDLLL